VEQCFATTQPAVRDELRSSRNGRRETANERRQNCVQLWNCPTQAKGRLGWATRHASHPSTSAMGGAAFFVVSIQRAKAVPALSLPRVVVGAGPQRPTGPVGADDDARGHSLRADEREFAWRGSIRKDTFASA